MAGRRSLIALASLVACLSAVAASAGAAKPGGIRLHELRNCSGESEELAPAPSRGVLVLLCEGPKGSYEAATLGALLPNGKIVRRAGPRGVESPFAGGPAGEAWAMDGSSGNGLELDRIAPDGTVARFPLGTPLPEATSKAYAIVAGGPGEAWVASGEGFLYFNVYNSLGGELTHVAADGTETHFPVPEAVEPKDLVLGVEGDLWFVGASGAGGGEHSSTLGKGYVGRMTPAGEFTLFPTAVGESSPGGIAVGPTGNLWFTEVANQVREIGTIATDGTFGSSLRVRAAYPQGPLAFGPEGDIWLPTFEGLMRVTPAGQQTLFPPRDYTSDVVIGAEGDIWTRRTSQVQSVIPGAPGIDILGIKVDRSSKKARVQLACGGSARGCEGILTLFMARERGTEPGARLARVHYSVAGESQGNLTIHFPVQAFTLARHAVPKWAGVATAAPVVVHATVAGGPTLVRRIAVPGLVTR